MWKSIENTFTEYPVFESLLDGDTKFIFVLVFLALFALILFGVEKYKNRRRPKKHSRPSLRTVGQRKKHSKFTRDLVSGQRYDNLGDPKVQMDYVQRASFKPIRLLNKEEYRLLPLLETICAELGQGHRVMAQTSLGEVIAADAPNKDFQRKAHASINSKRLDLAIFDRGGILKAAVEYQGGGHHQGSSFMRDAVKREALRKAGVPMIEITKGDDEAHIRTLVLRHLAPQQSSNSSFPPPP